MSRFSHPPPLTWWWTSLRGTPSATLLFFSYMPWVPPDRHEQTRPPPLTRVFVVGQGQGRTFWQGEHTFVQAGQGQGDLPSFSVPPPPSICIPQLFGACTPPAYLSCSFSCVALCHHLPTWDYSHTHTPATTPYLLLSHCLVHGHAPSSFFPSMLWLAGTS